MTAFAFLEGQAGNVLDTNAPEFPLLQWYNGKPELKQLGGVHSGGGFVFKAEQSDNFPVGTRAEYNYQNGDSAEIMAIGPASIAILASRLDWFTQDERGERTWIPHYEKGIGTKGRNRWLAFIRGAEEWHLENGPVMLSLYGINGVAMSKDVIGTFMHDYYKPLVKAVKRELDTYTFYIPIAPGPVQKAHPNHPTLITPPTLAMPKGCDPIKPNTMTKLFIGAAMMELAAEWWERGQEWAKADMNGSADESLESFAEKTLGGQREDGPPPLNLNNFEPPDDDDLPF